MGNFLENRSGEEVRDSSHPSKTLCERMQNSFGAWLTWFPYLTPFEQTTLQGLSRLSYERLVPRALRPTLLDKQFYLMHKKQILVMGCWSCKLTVLNTNFDSGYWNSLQIGKDIYQFKLNSQFRVLQNQGYSQFKVVKKAALYKRTAASFCNLTDQFIFATGGCAGFAELSSVLRYDIAKDFWEAMPHLNVARKFHGSCTLGTSVYVLCGYIDGDSSQRRDLNSIEKLETRDLQAGWQLIQMQPTSLLEPRSFPVVAVLNLSEILVMGGQGDSGYLGDAVIFDTRNNSVKKAASTTPFRHGELRSEINIREGVVVATVKNISESYDVVKYQGGKITILHHF